ncbi:hypothetical protein [Phaeobacter italicus]|jgi:hypothetical protein|uniref:hypothetical protein n=1 Tax=Phaeobacter italicus TaxID=481446 RepID=UPI001CD7B407|nr:hypothetical protein [Phaeobacter italicus]MCA0856136.1 hypothetical protein [Phaeobacter italicus]
MRNLVNAQMSALIDGTFGCLDAAAEAIHARTGQPVGKGTLSRRLSGNAGWPVDEVAALEDAAGRHPVTRALARRLKPDEQTAAGSIISQAGAISKETGEAVSAILAAEQSASGKDWAAAVSEIDEALEVLRRARGYAEKHMGQGND